MVSLAIEIRYYRHLRVWRAAVGGKKGPVTEVTSLQLLILVLLPIRLSRAFFSRPWSYLEVFALLFRCEPLSAFSYSAPVRLLPARRRCFDLPCGACLAHPVPGLLLLRLRATLLAQRSSISGHRTSTTVVALALLSYYVLWTTGRAQEQSLNKVKVVP